MVALPIQLNGPLGIGEFGYEERRPGALRASWVCWNKACRRDFAVRHRPAAGGGSAARGSMGGRGRSVMDLPVWSPVTGLTAGRASASAVE
jgi:hypothetical protein